MREDSVQLNSSFWGCKMRVSIALAALAMVPALATLPASAKCHLDRVNIYPNFDIAQSGATEGRSSCTIHFSNNAGGGVQSVDIVSQPTHGSVKRDDSAAFMGVVYKPASGYKGQDVFVYQVMSANARGSSGPSKVTVTVDVK